jgi:hypothetical protein
VTFAGALALWTGAGWILLAGRVRLRLLAAGGLLTAVGFAVPSASPVRRTLSARGGVPPAPGAPGAHQLAPRPAYVGWRQYEQIR